MTVFDRGATERLRLRRFDEGDLDWLAELYSDADVTRYLGGVRTRAEIEQMLEHRVLAYYDQHPGLGIWMTIERATGARAGFHLINHPYGETFLQIGFALDKWAWGRGYATEMAAALMQYAFLDLELPRIAAIASRDNLASQRVLLKIGLERRGDRALAHPAYAADSPLAFFERERANWPDDPRVCYH